MSESCQFKPAHYKYKSESCVLHHAVLWVGTALQHDNLPKVELSDRRIGSSAELCTFRSVVGLTVHVTVLDVCTINQTKIKLGLNFVYSLRQDQYLRWVRLPVLLMCWFRDHRRIDVLAQRPGPTTSIQMRHGWTWRSVFRVPFYWRRSSFSHTLTLSQVRFDSWRDIFRIKCI